MSEECIFCKIVSGESPATVELETDKVIAFESIDPAGEVHILVVPKRHIASFDEIKEDDIDTVMEMVETVQALVKKKGISEAYKIVVNGGGYIGINHLHWHLLGGNLNEDYQDKT
jgi:histidine triad (HIT) family protein